MDAVDICNLALGMIGHDRTITSLDDGSTEAVRCRLFLPVARRVLLEARDWTFARATRDCSGMLCAGSGRYTVVSVPSDALRVVRVECVDGTDLPVEFADGHACVDGTPQRVVYTQDNEDYDTWPMSAIDALAAALAFRLAGPMTGKEELVRRLAQQADAAMTRASMSDANQSARAGARDAGVTRGRPGDCIMARRHA